MYIRKVVFGLIVLLVSWLIGTDVAHACFQPVNYTNLTYDVRCNQNGQPVTCNVFYTNSNCTGYIRQAVYDEDEVGKTAPQLISPNCSGTNIGSYEQTFAYFRGSNPYSNAYTGWSWSNGMVQGTSGNTGHAAPSVFSDPGMTHFVGYVAGTVSPVDCSRPGYITADSNNPNSWIVGQGSVQGYADGRVINV